MIVVTVGRRGKVRARYSAELPLDAADAWRTLADFRRIVCLDAFHVSVDLHGRELRAGVKFDLPHRALGRLFERRGRILLWEEGRGYTFSDLSAPDPQRVFPHVFALTVEASEHSSRQATTATTSQLRLEVRGRWIARWLPRSVTRAWIGWNVWSMGTAIANAVLAEELARTISRPRCTRTP